MGWKWRRLISRAMSHWNRKYISEIKSNQIYSCMAACRLDYTITQSRPTQSHKVLRRCMSEWAICHFRTWAGWRASKSDNRGSTSTARRLERDKVMLVWEGWVVVRTLCVIISFINFDSVERYETIETWYVTHVCPMCLVSFCLLWLSADTAVLSLFLGIIST